MGVDLKLLPLIGPDFWAAHDILQLERRSELWDPISALPRKDIPKPLSCYFSRLPDGEYCYGNADKDPYDDPLKWVTAADLLTLKDHEAVQDNWQNKAVWAYLAHMPPEWKIVLYWH